MKTPLEKQKIEREMNKKYYGKGFQKGMTITKGKAQLTHLLNRYDTLRKEFNKRINLAKECVLEDVMEIIDKIKLPEDKNYRYSNEYIENWVDELKQKIEELRK
jgi:hypothetical protein